MLEGMPDPSASVPAPPAPLTDQWPVLIERLAAARTAEDVFRIILQPTLDALQAIAGAVLLVDDSGEHLEVVATQGHAEGAQTLWQDGPLSGNVPAGAALARREALFFHDAQSLGQTYPELESRIGQALSVASAVLPMFEGDHPIGTLVLDFPEPHHFSIQEQQFLRTLGAQCAIALGRAWATQQLEAQVRQRTQQLEDRTLELQRSNAELEQFAYIASHDLQAPIRTVISFAGLLTRKYASQLDERGQLYLHHIAQSGEHMQRLVGDLLTFSRVNTDHSPKDAVATEEVFDTVVTRLAVDQVRGEGGTVSRGPLPVVCVDAQQLDQLFQNLISNGLKYHRPEEPAQVRVSAEQDGEWWRFAVKDNGIGIEPQYFERIFEIFQRLHDRETYEGTGIGLAVCKKIVERHGGRLWLESEPQQGTTFFFTLPNC